MLNKHIDDAVLFKKLASLNLNVPLEESLEDLQWQGAKRKQFRSFCNRMGFSEKFTESIIRTLSDRGD